jgi:hypothetical protein
MRTVTGADAARTIQTSYRQPIRSVRKPPIRAPVTGPVVSWTNLQFRIRLRRYTEQRSKGPHPHSETSLLRSEHISDDTATERL